MHCTSNSVLWRLVQRAYRTLNKTAQDAIQHAMRTSNIIIAKTNRNLCGTTA